MISSAHSMGYRDSYKNGDKNAPILSEELNKFNHKVSKDSSLSSDGFRTYSSFVTPYGKEQIIKALSFRISNGDRAMSLIQFRSDKYNSNNFPEPLFQRDGISPPTEHQLGGWYMCNDKKELKQLPDYYKWNSFGLKTSLSKNKMTFIESGELLSSIEINNSNRSGFYAVLPHYDYEWGYGTNDFVGDVKSAILACCIDDRDKQSLLDYMYVKDDPVRKLDTYFVKKVKILLFNGVGDKNKIVEEININKVLSEEIKSNLIDNLSAMEYKDTRS
jgi:hypothetical protein